jgi:4-hydroxy-tetrahydrodipicolinate reductase
MPSTPIKLAVAGAQGRMGRAVLSAIEAREGVSLRSTFGRPGPSPDDLAGVDVVIDFTAPDASAALAALCAERGGPALVLGATGFTSDQEAQIAAAAQAIAIVRSGNFSLGVNVLLGLVRQAARALPAQAYDIEIVEAHHRRKVDAPSGTALMLGQAVAEGRGVSLDLEAIRSRDGITGPRPVGGIGFSVVRGGGIVGEHSVLFAAEDELLTLSHSARDRGLFARGAVEAALWVATRSPGLYDMQDVLGFAER